MSVAARDQEREAWARWRDAARTPAVDHAIWELYDRLDADIAANGPTCWQSGECCKFGAYGHRLYVTALEVAWFADRVSDVGFRGSGSERRVQTQPGDRRENLTLPVLNPTPAPRPPNPDTCPYQAENRCTTHAVRPLGCRIFFCQDNTQDWQHELYERYLSELRELHDAHRIDYRYAEWLALLAESSVETSSDSQSST